ncbi:sodium/potassium/calcium exchanger 4 [Tetranychus urticae]|uniref:Sodium/calcium exchanger membrane region domain-containing protein n=1 Tax=Tetranychus urticae TaxID=32264 RepID=T1JSR6_TETUR|nr:sodium/potassium/calcium exchanger 4 [Tetranychus urticae]
MSKLTLKFVIFFLVALVLPNKSQQQDVEFNLSLYKIGLMTDSLDYPSDEFQIWTPSSPPETQLILTSLSSSQSSSSLPVKDIMSDNVRNKGGFLIHIFILIYTSLSLALLCDSYFVPALQVISKGLKIPDDVSGATLMAMGTSAPELFTSLIALFQGESDIGTGTILGSAIFNLVGVPAVCGISIYIWGNKPSKVSPFPVVRDSVFYAVTVLALYLTLKDNIIDLPESSVLILLYGIYIFIMYINSRISDFISSLVPDLSLASSPSSSSLINEEKGLVDKNVQVENILNVGGKINLSAEYLPNNSYGSISEAGTDEDVDWIIEIPFLKYFLAPINFVFSITIPNHNRWTTLSFIISSVYIGLLTYVAVWAVNLLGFTLGIPDAIAGVTIMAAASSVPELVSNVIIIKKTGKANTALSNAIGSNVFDILICLGVPWFIRIVINYFQNIHPTSIHLQSKALPITTLSILTAILALLVILRISRWRLGLSVGLMSTMVYIILTVLSCSLGVSM